MSVIKLFKKRPDVLLLILPMLAYLGMSALFWLIDVKTGGNGWRTGEWLIHYGDGFVRRGLVGQILVSVASWSGMSVLYLVILLQASLVFVWLGLLIRLYLQQERNNAVLLLLLSPLFFMFQFYDVAAAQRKELLLYVVYLLYLLSWFSWQAKGKSPTLLLMTATVAYAGCILNHEMAAFMLPFFLFPLYLGFKQHYLSKAQALSWGATLSLVAAVGCLLALQFSGRGSSELICQPLLQLGAQQSVCTGSIDWLEMDVHRSIDNLAGYLQQGYLFNYGIAFVLMCLNLRVLRMNDEFHQAGRLLLISSFVCMLPLFVVAIDWGRWLSVFFCFAVMLLLVMRQHQMALVRFTPPLWLVVLNTVTWSVKHYGQGMEAGMWFIVKKVFDPTIWQKYL